MGRLIQWGWIDPQGRSLSWRHWQRKPHRVPVAYWRDKAGKLTPIYDIQPSQVMVRRDKA